MSNVAIALPSDVTSENWAELQAKGFEWLTNLSWPLEEDTGNEHGSEESYVEGLQRQYGYEQLLFGWPMNKTGKPQADAYAPAVMCGVYVRR